GCTVWNVPCALGRLAHPPTSDSGRRSRGFLEGAHVDTAQRNSLGQRNSLKRGATQVCALGMPYDRGTGEQANGQ
ncbi:hypothetical protein NDU88_011076, partial [Pleurodeles waltl]